MNRSAIKFTIERLRAIDADEVLRKQFTLEYWADQASTHPLDVPEDPKCGFSGCYMGWAIHQQWYARWGLMLDFGSIDTDRDVMPGNIMPLVRANSTSGFQKYTGDAGKTDNAVAAVADLLGLDLETFRQVIYEEAYKDSDHMGPGDVADRLSEILEFGEETFARSHSERLERWEEERQAEGP